MDGWNFALVLIATAVGYFCAGVVYGRRDAVSRFEAGMEAMARIDHEVYGIPLSKVWSSEPAGPSK